MDRRHRPWILTISFVAISVLCTSCGGEKGDGFDAAKSQWMEIDQALAEYLADRGSYPISLNKLCPEFLDEVPAPPPDIEAWKYYASAEDDSYSVILNHATAITESWIYNSDVGEWIKLDNGF